MLQSANHHDPLQDSTPLLSASSTRSNTTTSSSNSSDADADESPAPSFRYDFQALNFKITCSQSYKSLAVLSGHVGSVSCLALCGEFILSASQGKDIIVWQQPDLRQFTKFGQGDGAVKALVTAGNRVFTAHQDSRIRAWKVSRSSENVFKLIDTLPTTKDYLGKFMKQSNYVQTRRHHKLLWIEHADTISCLAVSAGLIYSGSWDKTIKVWRVSDFKCLESIKAHDDAINGLSTGNGVVYSASADGRIKAWAREAGTRRGHSCRGVLEGHKDVSFNSVVVTDDGDFVYGGGSDGSLMGWFCDEGWTWRAMCDVRGHETAVLCVCLMGGMMLCSGSADKSVCVWRREVSGGLVRHMVIKGHQGPVKCLQASPVRVGGGFMLYSGSLDRSLRVWWVPADDKEDKEKQWRFIN
ncbi:protein JINGUBANG [Salvia miltiorrhiza]|uniref:protein JINGUBANG n=1 Tax=Salvia miltiorrhiza TaxID=226208 RepID=UPI0025ABF9C1|nr:protein JINGUBANG [Salvia miltiorrhiza]